MFADPTPLVRTPAQLDAFARYEYAIGGYPRVAPMRAVCAYDRSEIDDRAIAELACVHERSNVPISFHIIAGTPGGMAVLSGELDGAVEGLFVTALRRSELGRPELGRSELARSGGAVVIDARGLRFIDHRALLHLQRHARENAVTVVLRTAKASVRRLAGLLELSHVRVEIAG